MPNASRMEKKKATVRKSMIQLKSAEDVMNLFEDVVVGPIEIAPIKGEGVSVDVALHFSFVLFICIAHALMFVRSDLLFAHVHFEYSVSAGKSRRRRGGGRR